jgi:beta-lactamase superfamily II metal-dependent hydrolase
MSAKAQDLAARRAALLARCDDQRAQLAQECAALGSGDALGLVPAFLNRHRKAALLTTGVAAGLFLTRPKWAVGIATGAVSAYQLAQRLLPLLRWKGFEIH